MEIKLQPLRGHGFFFIAQRFCLIFHLLPKLLL
jgi:hypothetical protein